MSWGERSTGISPTITGPCSRPCSTASTASTPISRDFDEQIETRPASFMCKTTILDTRVLIDEDPGAAPTPLVLAQVDAKPEGAQPADTRRRGEVRQPTCRRWL